MEKVFVVHGRLRRTRQILNCVLTVLRANFLQEA